MDPDQFAQSASAAQSIVTSIGIIAGGLWVLFTFWNLRLMHRSRAEIAEIEQRAVEQPVLSLAIQSETTEAVIGEKRFISLGALLRMTADGRSNSGPPFCTYAGCRRSPGSWTRGRRSSVHRRRF
jgi:hypothetical protein